MKTIILLIGVGVILSSAAVAEEAGPGAEHQFTGQGLPQDYVPGKSDLGDWVRNFCSVQLRYLQDTGKIPTDWAFAKPDLQVSPNSAGPMLGKSLTVTCDFQSQSRFDGKGGGIQLTVYTGTVAGDGNGLYVAYRP
jgi:hypothetical protein